MPGLSGAEVAAHIVATKPDQPILFVSGYNETDEIRRVAPDANILAKPFRAAALEEAVARPCADHGLTAKNRPTAWRWRAAGRRAAAPPPPVTFQA